jgi:hypothetical protein
MAGRKEMKTITAQQLEGVIENIIHDKEEQAKLRKETFTGITENEVIDGIVKRLGVDWVLVKEPPLKLSKDDLNAVANSRFYRKTGGKLLMGLAIIVLGLAILTLTVPLIPPKIYYVVITLVAVGFVYMYSKKQREARKELWTGIEGEDKKK